MHSSSLKRKLSSTSASLDGLPCHSGATSAGRTPRTSSILRPAPAAAAAAERAHLPNGVASGAVDSETARDVSPKRRRRTVRQQQLADGGVPPPSPHLSGAAAGPSAASPGERGKGFVQQQQGRVSAQEQPSEARTADTDTAGGYLGTPHARHAPAEV